MKQDDKLPFIDTDKDDNDLGETFARVLYVREDEIKDMLFLLDVVLANPKMKFHPRYNHFVKLRAEWKRASK